MLKWFPIVILLAALAPSPVLANEQEDSFGDARTVYQINLKDEDGRPSTIRQLVVVSEEGALYAKTRHGLSRRNQDRVDYSSVPLIGKFSEHRYDKPDFSEANRVGAVRVDRGLLFLVLDQGAPVTLGEVRRIAVLNQEFAFETRRGLGAPNPQGAATSAPGREVGGVFWTGGGTLMALVRPFVVTDGGLW